MDLLSTLSDEQLMAQVTSGDVAASSARAALTLLVERHHGSLLGYLYRFVGGERALAEDLTQETFIRVIKRSSYRPCQPFKPWLYAIATNLARDHFRSAATRYASHGQDDVLLDAVPDIPDRAPGPEERALLTEGRNEVAEAIGQLSVEYRATLLLRFYEGMSLQEISGALNVPVGTVKSRLSVGCRRLRDLLAGERGEYGGSSSDGGDSCDSSEVGR